MPPHKLKDFVQVLESVLHHAREAHVTAADLAPLSRRFLETAQLCRDAGFESEAQRCLALAPTPVEVPAGPRRVLGRIAHRLRLS